MEIRRRLAVWLLVVGALAMPWPAVQTAAAQPTVAAQDEFVPIDALPLDEQLPAAPLVLAAYAASWLIVMVYLWSIWQRLGRVEREIKDVSRRVEQTPPGPTMGSGRSEGGPVAPKLRGSEGGPVPPKLRRSEGGPVAPKLRGSEGGPVAPKLRGSEGG